MPIVEKDGAVRQALMGTMTQVLGLDLTTSGLRQNNDGPWVQGGRPRGRGISAVLLHQGRPLGHSHPVLHHHPEPAPTSEEMSFGQACVSTCRLRWSRLLSQQKQNT